MIRIGVIGYGYWGPNIVRNFILCDGAEVVSICDIAPDALKRAKKRYPTIECHENYRNMLSSKELDAVAIITPVFTHYKIAKESLENGKHIFVEKPFTNNAEEAEGLIKLADKKNLKIMVDHTFLFTGAVRKIKDFVKEKALGDLYYYDSARVNLGLFQHDVNVIWDLAPHDLSIMDHVIEDRPTAIAASGMDHLNTSLENIAYITVYFDKMIAHLSVNWLSPVKIRRTCIGGNKKMLVWDDLEPDEKIKIYDKGVEVKNKEGIYNLLVDYRSGDMHVPALDHTEALKIEAQYFIDCILNDSTPINDGHAGLRIVKLLQAANESLKNKGRVIKL